MRQLPAVVVRHLYLLEERGARSDALDLPPAVALQRVVTVGAQLAGQTRVGGLVADRDGEVTISLMGRQHLSSVDRSWIPVWVYWDGMTAEGAELVGGGFEQLDKDGKLEYWSFGSWHGADASEYKITLAKGEGRTGNALKLTGVSGRINMTVGQPVDLLPGTTYVLSGHSKGNCNGGYASLIGKSTTGAKGQYTNTRHLAKSADWAPFAWEITPAPDNKNYVIYLRSTSIGSVYFDDVTLSVKE